VSEASEERRLTTILAADVVGFSRLMAVDEAGTLTSLKAIRRELIQPKTAEHHGRVVKLIGDGILMEFGSVVGAIRFAVDVQRAMALRNTDVPEDRRIVYRIGINIGDIIVEGEDIYGDGVNVAARLEALAEPGGICISRAVHGQVRGKVDLAFKDLGEQQVKNIPEPLQVFRVLFDIAAPNHGHVTSTKPKRSLRWPLVAAGLGVFVIVAGIGMWQRPWIPHPNTASEANMAFPLPDRPSIAILPFDNLSGNPEQEYFADGMTDDLITDLSKVSGLFVIARNSTFVYKGRPVEIRQVAEDLGVRYVMEGSVQRAGNTVRINAQLIDAISGGHVWADRFDGAVEDIFRVQDEFIRKIVQALSVKLLPQDAEHIGQGQTSTVAAREAFQKGWELYLRFSPEDNFKAIEHVKAAIKLDPEYGRAYALLALIYLNDIEWDWWKAIARNVNPSATFDEAQAYIELAKDHPTALGHVAASRVAIRSERHDEAIEEARQAIAIEPNEPEAYIAMASALITSNNPRGGLEFVEMAFRLNPQRPAHYYLTEGFAYFALGDLEKAAEAFKAGVDQYPDARELLPPLASTYALLGQKKDARQALLRWRPTDSQLMLEQVPQIYYLPLRWPSSDLRVFDRFFDGLYTATLPLETTVSSLIETAQHGDVFQRLKAIKDLGHMGLLAANAVPTLIGELSDEEQEIRKEAAIALGKIGPAATEAIQALEKLQDQIIVGGYATKALKSIKGE